MSELIKALWNIVEPRVAARRGWVNVPPFFRGGRSSVSLFASMVVGLACLVGAATFGANAARAQGAARTTIAIPTDFALNMIQGSDGNLYSTSGTPDEGCPVNGTTTQCSFIYKITPSGTISTFYAFQEVSNTLTGTSTYITNLDGLQPTAFFEGADGNFYGACESGGAYGLGTIFKITPGGTLTVLYAFPSTTSQYGGQVPLNGGQPNSLIQGADGNLYGTSLNGSQSGTGNGGMFFQVTTTGAFTVINYFPLSSNPAGGTFDFPDGDGPTSIVQGSNGNFYISMTAGAGVLTTPRSNLGAINEITPGGGVTQFFTFPADGSEGVPSVSPLVEGSDGSMYGTTDITINNPNNYPSLIYKLSPSGDFARLYQFTGGPDGARVIDGGLFPGSDGNFYGVANYGGNTTSSNCLGAPLPGGTTGPAGCGTFFQMQPSGTLTTLYTFAGGVSTTLTTGLASADGAHPLMPITQGPGGLFYGVTVGYGATGIPVSYPTVYSLALTQPIPSPVQLSFSVNGQPVTSVTPNSTVTLNWQVPNAFSLTAQQCHASVMGSPIGAGNWGGPQIGSLVGNVYSGTATITPTAAGNFTYVLNCGGVEIGTAALSVSGVMITTTTLPGGVVSIPYNAAVQATGGVTPYTWGSSGALPAGLDLQATASYAAINVAGTPTQFGKYQVIIGAQDSSSPPQTGLQTFTVNIASGLTLVGSLNNATVGTAYNMTATATGGLPPYKWSITSGKLPTGLTLNASSGVLAGTPTVAGNYTFSITVTDSEGMPATFTQSYTVSTVVPPLTVEQGSFPNCTVNALCEGQFAATGGTPPYTWAIEAGEAFPAGLKLAADGGFTGLPTQYNCIPPSQTFGAFSTLSVQVTDSSTPPVTAAGFNSLCIVSGLTIVSIPLPVATVGVFYQAPPPVATGGLPPYTWKITGTNAQFVQEFGDNPAIGAIYSIAGGPTIAATDYLLYTLTDSESMPAAVQTMSATLTVNPASVTSVTTLASSNGAAGVGMPVILTAKTTASAGTPTGVVTFYNGSAILGTATLDATGTALLSTSFPTPGVYSLTASYAGSGTIMGSVSSALTETVVTVGVTGSISPASLTIASGSSGTLTITVTPMGGYSGVVTFSCGTLPANVSCTFVPPSLTLTAGSGPVSDTLTIHTMSQTAALTPSSPLAKSGIYLGMVLWLPASFMGLCGLLRRKRKPFRVRSLLTITVICLGLAGTETLIGCAGGPSRDAQAGTYTIPVTLTLASGSTQTVSATVVVQ